MSVKDILIVIVVVLLMALSVLSGLFIGVPNGDAPYLERVFSRENLETSAWLLVGSIVLVLTFHWLRSLSAKKPEK